MSYNVVDQSTGALKQAAGSTLTAIYADAPLGAIAAFGGDTAPTGWLICDGSAVSRITYADLFAVIGTKYGSGDESTTFNLPDGETGAALYPAEDVGSGIVGSKYIIKAIATALPSDIQTQIDGCAKLAENNNLTGVTSFIGKDIINKNTSIDSDATPAQMIIGNSVLYFRDVNDKTLAAIYNHQKTDGSIDLNIVTDQTNTHQGKVLINGNDIIEKLYPTPIIVPVSGTYGNIIKQVLNAIDISKITKDSVIVAFGIMFHYVGNFVNYHQFSAQIASPGEGKLLSITMAGTTSDGVYYHITSGTNGTAFVDATTVSLSAQNVTVYY